MVKSILSGVFVVVALLLPAVCAADTLQFAAEPTSVVLPGLPGSIGGVREESTFGGSMGSVTLGLSIPLPASTGGPEPGTTIRYSSERGQGILGAGWSLEQGRLCRQTDRGVPRYGEPPTELELLDVGGASGELVATGGGMALRWETESVLLRPQGEGFVLDRADGSRWSFGLTPGSRRGPDARIASGTACWYVDEVEDVHGRRMQVTYLADASGGHALVDEVRFGEANRGGHRAVRYEWEARPDIVSDYRYGYPRSLTQRLAAIFVEWEDVSGERVRLRTARMSYTVGDRGTLLASMRVLGEQGESLPLQSFEYGESSADYSSIEVVGVPADLDGAAASLSDLDGDGFADILERRGTDWQWRRNLAGGGQPVSFSSVAPVDGLASLNADEWRMVDVDGDGLRDIVSFEAAAAVWYRNQTAAAEGARFSRQGEVGLRRDSGFGAAVTRFADVNADGIVDAIGESGGRLLTALGEVERSESGGLVGGGARGFALPEFPAIGSGVEGWERVELLSMQFCDMNGDSLLDVVRVSGAAGAWSALVHAGDGSGEFGAGALLTLPEELVSTTSPEQVQFADVSGDGRCDLLVTAGIRVGLHVQQTDGSWRSSFLPTPSDASAIADVVMSDVNGDGRPDALFRRSNGTWALAESRARASQALMTVHDNGMGQRRLFEWASSAREPVVGDEMRQHRPVVAELRQEIAGSPTIVTEWTYGLGRWDEAFGGFAGFEWVQQRLVGDKETGAPDQTVLRQYHAGVAGETTGFGGLLGRDDEVIAADDLRGLRGAVRLERWIDEAGGLIQESRTIVELSAFGAQYRWRNRESVVVQAEGLVRADGIGERGDPQRAESMRDALWGETLRFAHQLWEWDERGQLVRHQQRGAVRADGSELAGDELCTETSYTRHADSWRRTGPSERRELDGSCTDVVQFRRWYYDGPAFTGLPHGEVERGLIQREAMYFAEEERWIDQARMARNAAGAVTERVDALGHRTVFAYDEAYDVFPTLEVVHLDAGAYGRTSAGALTASGVWDAARGRMVEHTDFAGVSTAIDYDGLDREVLRIEAIRSPAARTIRTQYDYDEQGGRVRQEYDALEGGGRTEERLSILDGAGRGLAALVVGDGATRVEQRVQYGLTGAPLRQWETYVVADESQWADDTPQGVGIHSLIYDSMGRLVTHQAPGGFTTTSRYGVGLTETTNDADRSSNSVWRDTPDVEFQDVFGRMTRVRRTLVEAGSGAVRYVDTAFSYDALNRRTEVVRDHGARRVWRYDSLGRVSEYQDTQTGLTTWSYDDAGRVIARVNGASDTVVYDYDAAGRVVRVSAVSAEQEPPEVLGTFEYDVSPTGAEYSGGRLVASNEGSVRTEIDWTPWGEPWRRRRMVDERVWEISYQYDVLGRIRRTRYPGNHDVAHDYDSVGHLVGVSDVVDEIVYNERALPTTWKLNDRLTMSRSWDEQRRRTGFSLSTGARQLLDMRRVFGEDDTVSAIEDRLEPDSVFSQSLTVTADGWGRTTSVVSPAYGRLDWALDGVGRLQARDHDASAGVGSRDMPALGLSNLRYQDLDSDLLVEASGRSWTMDRQGRVIASRDGADEELMTWDAVDHLREVVSSDGSRMAFEWAVNFTLLRQTAYDEGGRVVESRLSLDRQCEQITDDRGSWLRIRYQVHGEDLARRELLRVDGDWSGETTEPLPLIRYTDPGREQATRLETSPVPSVPDTVEWMAGRTRTEWPLEALAGMILLLRVAAGEALRRRRANGARAVLFARLIVLVPAAGATLLAGVLVACSDVEPEPGTSDGSSIEEGSSEPTEARSDRDDIYYMFAPWLGTVVMQTDEAGEVIGRTVMSPDGVEVRRQFDGTGLYYERFANAERSEFMRFINFGTRFYDPESARWLSADPLAMLDQLSSAEMNAYVYVGWRLLQLLDALGLSGLPEDASNAVNAVGAGEGLRGLMEMADSGGSALGPVARVFGGVVSGFVAGGTTAMTLIDDGASTGDVIVGSGAAAGAGALMNMAAASNPVTASLMMLDSSLGIIDPSLSVTPTITAGYTGAALTITGAAQGDLSTAHNFVDGMQSGSAGYVGAIAANHGDRLARWTHQTVMTGRHAVVDATNAYQSTTDAGADAIGAIDGAVRGALATVADWIDR